MPDDYAREIKRINARRPSQTAAVNPRFNEPSPSEINPNLSSLVELTQRSSPHISKKSMEEKSEKDKNSSSTADFSDDATLSDEMLGDMEPDEESSRDQASDFKRHLLEWTDQDEIEADFDEAERYNSEDGEEDETNSGGSGSFFDSEEELDNSIFDDDETDEPEIAMQESDNNNDSVLKSDELEDAEENEIQAQADEINSQPEKPKSSKFSLSENKKQQTDEEQPDAHKSSISLLTYEDGFIIADSYKAAGGTEKEKKRSCYTAGEHADEPKPALPVHAERFACVFESLIICNEKNDAYQNLSSSLKLFGIKSLELCKENNEKVLLIPSSKKLGDFPELFNNNYPEWAQDIRWGYFPKEKLVVIGEEALTENRSSINIPILYFAFALDNAVGTDGFASMRSPAVLANFKSCQTRQSAHQFIDSFSGTSPAHYFARAVEAFLTAPQDQLTGNHTGDEGCTKEELYDIDRSMYMYIEYLFKQINRGEQFDDHDKIDGSI